MGRRGRGEECAGPMRQRRRGGGSGRALGLEGQVSAEARARGRARGGASGGGASREHTF